MVTVKEYGFSFRGDKNVLKLIVVMAAHICEYTKKTLNWAL